MVSCVVNVLEEIMNKILNHSIVLKCSIEKAFQMFTVNDNLELWLTEEADVTPFIDGKFELFWVKSDKKNNSTIGCKVTGIEKNKFISFEWKGPVQFKHFMNNADPLTHVTVFFIPLELENNNFSQVFLLHTGWRNTEEWEEARSYFKKAWTGALNTLQKIIDPVTGV